MDDDLDTANALALVFDAARRGNAAIDADDTSAVGVALATVNELTGAVGLLLKADVDEIPAEASAKAAALDAARATKDFASADTLRGELQADGWIVETTKAGTTIRK